MKTMNDKEAAVDYANNYFEMHETNNYKALKQGFEAGTNWIQERMYSEADMRDYGLFYLSNQWKGNELLGKDLFKEWVKQHKNK